MKILDYMTLLKEYVPPNEDSSCKETKIKQKKRLASLQALDFIAPEAGLEPATL